MGCQIQETVLMLSESPHRSGGALKKLSVEGSKGCEYNNCLSGCETEGLWIREVEEYFLLGRARQSLTKAKSSRVWLIPAGMKVNG